MVSPRYIPEMTFSYALKCGLLESRSTLLSNGVRGSMMRPLSNAPQSVLTIISPPAATAGLLPTRSLVMMATCAPFVPVLNRVKDASTVSVCARQCSSYGINCQ